MDQKKQSRLGSLGELLVSHYFKGDFKLSEDKYDMTGDGTFSNGTLGEVKTQAIFKWYRGGSMPQPAPAFTVPFVSDYGKVYTNQFNKCKTVDRLFFVALPQDSVETIRIFEAPAPEDRIWYTRKSRTSKRIDQGILLSDCKLLAEYSDKNITESFKMNSQNTDLNEWEQHYQ